MFKSAYSPKERVFTILSGKTLTQQHSKNECDINQILKKYRKTGLLDHVNTYQGKYDDLSQPIDYQTALNVVINAKNSFDSLPSNIRKKFDNEPAKFLDFVGNPDNLDEMREMGLMQLPKDLGSFNPNKPTEITDETPPAPTE